MNKYPLFFYFLSFLEGASVMAAELLGAKMLAPYFGTSLYVWSSVLAVTLGGLAAGYFAGGVISSKKNSERSLYYTLLISAVFLMVMPLLAKWVMVHSAGLDLLGSILFSSLVFLFPPVFFMGMVSPLIVECIVSAPRMEADVDNRSVSGSGKTAGAVYAVSTVGGILSTFFLGFYGIPLFGLTKPAIILGILLGIIPFIKLVNGKNFLSLVFIPVAIGTVFFLLSSSKFNSENSEVKILYSSEGLLGQIIVGDYPLYENGNKSEGSQRILFVNRSTQTVVTHKDSGDVYFEYVHMISGITNGLAPERNRALVFGLGGGSVAGELAKNGFQVKAVELDRRMADVAKKYFSLPGMVEVYIDDARHYLNGNRGYFAENKLDVVVLDAFVGEVNPHHLFTQEFFQQVGSVLSDSGYFFINGNGYWNGDAGKGMRSVCKTLLSAGFNVSVVPTREEEDYRNLVFIAQKSSANIGTATGAEVRGTDLENALVLVDEKPELELLNAEANRRWREACMKYFLSGYYSKQDRLLFK